MSIKIQDGIVNRDSNNLVLKYLSDKAQWLGGKEGDAITDDMIFEFAKTHIDGMSNSKANNIVSNDEIDAWFNDNPEAVQEFAHSEGYEDLNSFINDFSNSLRDILSNKKVDAYLNFQAGNGGDNYNVFDYYDESYAKDAYLKLNEDIVAQYDLNGDNKLDFDELHSFATDILRKNKNEDFYNNTFDTLNSKGDNMLNSEEAKEYVKDFEFGKLDKNKDGNLDQSEMKDATIVKNNFNSINQDGDDTISQDEFLSKYGDNDRIKNVFNRYAGNDNKIDNDEFTNFIIHSKDTEGKDDAIDYDEFSENVDDKEGFNKADIDKNGKLDRKELRKYLDDGTATLNALDILENLDLDGDDKISAKERAVFDNLSDRGDAALDGKINFKAAANLDITNDELDKHIQLIYNSLLPDEE